MTKENNMLTVIRRFFGEGDFGVEVKFEELKDLTSAERNELGNLCREALRNSQSLGCEGFIRQPVGKGVIPMSTQISYQTFRGESRAVPAEKGK